MRAAAQPHPDPIAWMVGTAIWWTKEEAERDAEAMGLPVVGLGPMSAIVPAEQHQSEPVAWRAAISGNWQVFSAKQEAEQELADWLSSHSPEEMAEAHADGLCNPQPLYTHADPAEALNDLEDAKEACAEIERTGMPGEVIREMNDEIVDLRDALEDLLKGSGSSPGAAKKYAKARAALARKA